MTTPRLSSGCFALGRRPGITAMPEVMEFHRMAGEVDYMLKVVVRDMKMFDEFYKRLIDLTALNDVTSRFSMEIIKETTARHYQR